MSGARALSTTMTNAPSHPHPGPKCRLTARLVLDGRHRHRRPGLGATGTAVGEVCFNTAITGYQEILTDPELRRPDHHLHVPPHRQRRRQQRKTPRRRISPSRSGVRGCILRADITEPSNYRSAEHLDPLAEGARHHRDLRRRHARTDGAHPREGHAERRHRARAVGQVRHRQIESRSESLARPLRPRPRAGSDERAELLLG